MSLGGIIIPHERRPEHLKNIHPLPWQPHFLCPFPGGEKQKRLKFSQGLGDRGQCKPLGGIVDVMEEIAPKCRTLIIVRLNSLNMNFLQSVLLQSAVIQALRGVRSPHLFVVTLKCFKRETNIS